MHDNAHKLKRFLDVSFKDLLYKINRIRFGTANLINTCAFKDKNPPFTQHEVLTLS